MKIRIVDDLSPEDVAMLQALYSRSAESVDVHIEQVKKTGSGKFMSSYYVGYGHKSIADCGSTTLFLEGVSLLAAKAIQDWPLYSGQETSTRYIDMSKQPIIDPVGSPNSKVILDRWMTFYRANIARVDAEVRRRHPLRDHEDVDKYTRAVKARTFDIMRGFLPAGITTQLSWHTNLRQASDHLDLLELHPCPEIASIGSDIAVALALKYPSSGFEVPLAGVSGVSNRDEEARLARRHWLARNSEEFTYPSGGVGAVYQHATMSASRMARHMLALSPYAQILKTRPRGCVLPHWFTDFGQIEFNFRLDFGSFRDLQRHRNGVCRMPLLEAKYFSSWYLDQLDDELRLAAIKLINEQTEAIDRLTSASRFDRQYYCALGFEVPCSVTYALPALLYVLELRSSKTVHPTLRQRVREMILQFRASFPDVALHVELDPDDWTIRRGEQTIAKKDQSAP